MALVKWKLEAEIEETVDDNGEIVQPDEIARLIRAAMPDRLTVPSIKMGMVRPVKPMADIIKDTKGN